MKRDIINLLNIFNGNKKMKSDEELEDVINKNIILIGNPGVGKSTILNGLINTVEFKSGVSYGKGLTSVLQSYFHNGINYKDTPGLSDVDLRKQAAKEITKSFRKNGSYKLIFVLTVESGRVKPDDVTTINLVLDSIDVPVYYGVIVNKVTKRFVEDVSNNKKIHEALFGSFNTGNHKTNYFYYLEKDTKLEDQDNVLTKLPDEVVKFIHNVVPYTVILTENVKEIQVDQYKKIQEEFEEKLKKVREDSEEAKKVMKQTIENLEKQREKSDALNKDLIRKFEEKENQMKRELERQKREANEKIRRIEEKMNKANEDDRRIYEEKKINRQYNFDRVQNDIVDKIEQVKTARQEIQNRPPPPPPSNNVFYDYVVNPISNAVEGVKNWFGGLFK